MSEEESPTPDLVELGRRSSEAVNGGDLDAMVSFFAPDAVWDLSPVGMGTFEGRTAIRGFAEDWLGAYEEFEMKAEERHDLGNGVTFSVIRQNARPAASQGHVATRYAAVAVWVEGMIVRATQYADVDEARAVGERLAEELEKAVSHDSVRLVERAITAINARDIEGYLACCTEDVKLETPVAAVGGVFEGIDGIRRYFGDIEDAGPDFRIELDGVEEVDSKRVLASMRFTSTGRASGIPLAAALTNVYDLVDGKISHVRIFVDRQEALRAVGLEE